MDTRRLALLIDSDNISSRYMSCIIEEVAKYGIASYRRIYGDWTSPQAAKWRDELLTNNITPIQQFSNTVGKNATDSALIIDAMDILYGGDVDGFCIVSSDSDFTRLASRLRESAMMVIGLGENKTPSSFRNACTKFVSLENLYGQEAGEDTSSEGVIAQGKIEEAITTFMSENEGKGKPTSLAMVGACLSNKYPDFDVRNYGYSSLSKFIEDTRRFNIERKDNVLYVSTNEDATSQEVIENIIINALGDKGSKPVLLSDLSNMVHAKFPAFDQRNYGYAQFNKFVQNIPGIEVVSISETIKGARRS